MSASRLVPVLGLFVALGCGGERAPTTASSGSPSSGAGGHGGAGGGPGACGDGIDTTLVDPARTPELAIAGDPGSPMGIFDPSMVYPSGAIGGALSYSSVSSQDAIRTRIAVSADAGAHWTYVTDANTVEAATIDSTDPVVCPGGSCSGNLINEVSSLILDPEDPDPTRRWKLFAHRYLAQPNHSLLYRYGYIALYTASKPEGPWVGPANSIGWSSETPLSSVGAGTNISQIPALADCLALTEPGALWVPGVGLDLALGCVSLENGVSIRIERLRSTDHGATFHHVGTLLDGADAPCLGGTEPRINAAELFFAGGKEYLIATPGTESEGYRGCYVFPIDDPITGVVRRDGQGKAIYVRRLDNPDQRFTGACCHAEGAPGYLVPIAFLDEPPRVFRTFRTSVVAP